MRRGTRGVLLLAMAVGVYACGCTRSSTRRPGLQDPLLMSKTPVKAKFGDASTALPSRPEPTPPALPAGVWVSAPAQPDSTVRLGPPDFRTPPPSTSLTWSTDKPVPDVSGQGPYGRAADGRWLQGVLERLGEDQWVLRYEPIARGGDGGKVLLEGHPRLDLLNPGDVIRVEGELIREQDNGKTLPHPRFRVARLVLVQRR
jgi:hypothetical protein